MLQLTSAAATQVAQAREARGLPETVGLRVSGERQPGGRLSLSLTFARVPAEDDMVSEQAGTRVFVAPEVVEPLATATLDAEETTEGVKLILKSH